MLSMSGGITGVERVAVGVERAFPSGGDGDLAVGVEEVFCLSEWNNTVVTTLPLVANSEVSEVVGPVHYRVILRRGVDFNRGYTCPH